MFAKAILDLKKGLALYYVWAFQAYHDITAKYKRTALGTFWIAGGMVTTSVSLAIIFGALFHQNLQEALPYVMAGTLVFGMTSFVFFDGTEMFMSSGGIIKNHAYPFTFYAFHNVCKNFFLFLHNLLVFWAFMLVIGTFKVPHWSVIFAIPVVLVFMFTWGMLAGLLGARFRDMRFGMPYIGQLFSMLTPIFWKTDTLPPKVKMIVELNPVFDVIQIIRMPLLGQMASNAAWTYSLCYTGLGLVLWFFFFSALRRRIPFWV